MEIKVNKINSANAIISSFITAEDISSEVEKIVKQLAKTTTLPGFRKGKVPTSAVKKYYGSRLIEDAEAEILRSLLEQALSELSLSHTDLITEPDIVDFKRTENNGILVTVALSLKPIIGNIEINSLLEDIVISEATTEAIEQETMRLLKNIASFNIIERKSQNGDRVNIDFSGFINGELFDGGTATGYDLILGSNSFISGFEEQLVGYSAGDNIDVTVVFPENYTSDLNSKTAIFKCKINQVEESETLVLDNATAEKIIANSFSALRKKNQEVDAIEFVKNEISNSIFEKNKIAKFDELKESVRTKLLNNVNFDLPKSVLEKELENRVNNSARTMTEAEIEEVKNNPAKLEELQNKFLPESTQAVKLTFIVDKISKENNITVEDKEIEESLKYQFIMSGQDPDLMMQTYKERNILPLVKMSVLEDRVLEFIINSKIKR